VAYKDGLSGEAINVAELFKFTLKDATEIFFTSFEEDIIFLTDTYNAGVIWRTRSLKDIDMSVGEIKVTIPADDTYFDTDDILNLRILDYATLEIYQVDRDNLANYRLNFKGVISTVNINDEIIEMTVRNNLNLLKNLMPRRKYSEGCPWAFGDSNCTLTLSGLKVSSTTEAGSDTDTIVDTALTEADHYWRGGYVEMTSGTDSGLKREVKSFTAATDTVELLRPFPNTTLGETYDIYPHCEKNYTRCDTDFSNSDHFGGFQHIPRPEEVLL